jgi:hypothetical protein
MDPRYYLAERVSRTVGQGAELENDAGVKLTGYLKRVTSRITVVKITMGIIRSMV